MALFNTPGPQGRYWDKLQQPVKQQAAATVSMHLAHIV